MKKYNLGAGPFDNFCHASATIRDVWRAVQMRTARHMARKSNQAGLARLSAHKVPSWYRRCRLSSTTAATRARLRRALAVGHRWNERSGQPGSTGDDT